MDRYNDVKILLKNWEQDFVKQHQRKPNKEDIDQAPEETKQLYKEYRSLKQCSVNSSSKTVSSGSTAEKDTTSSKDTDCWGSHLNRKSLPVAAPKLSSEERENLQASSQYYGLKLKSNLVSLGKERPVSLKKTPNRTPLNSLKDEERNSPFSTPKRTLHKAFSNPFSPRFNGFGSPASRSFPSEEPEEPKEPKEPKEPEEHIEPFAPFIEPSNSCSDTNSVRKLSLLSSLSPSKNTGTSPESITSAKDKDDSKTTQTADKLNVLKSPTDFRGGLIGKSATPKPSLTNRLTHIDKKWLERCQVFGELGAEEKPVVGNKEVKEQKTEIKHVSDDRVKRNDRSGEGEVSKVDACESSGQNTEEKAAQRKRKSKKDDVKEDKTMDTEAAVSIPDEEEEEKAKSSKRKSQKRQRGDEAGEEEDESGATKNKRKSQKRQRADEAGDEEDESGATKNKRKSQKRQRGDEAGEEEDESGATKNKRKSQKRQRGDEAGEEEDESGATKNKRKSQKRQRGDEAGEEEDESGATKNKRRRKKKEVEVDGDETTPKPERKRRAKKKKDEEEEEEEVKTVKEPKKPPQENLFGEVEDNFGARKLYQPGLNKTKNMKTEGNFVKINLKKKSHVKGYALRGMAMRRQIYMEKFQLKGERVPGGFRGGFRGRRGGFRGSINRQGDTCYKCGGTGHWASDCKGRASVSSAQDEPLAEDEPFELPTLEEVARATGTLKSEPIVCQSNTEDSTRDKDEDGEKRDEILLNVIRPDYERPPVPTPLEPLFTLREDGKVQETPAEVHSALKDLGYSSFRAGQEDAIMRILSGLSTLVVLSTGMGKSLCYQLPAYLYYQRSKCLTLVISPLVSLMDDQLSGISPRLQAACIHSNMTMKQREAAIEKVKAGEVCVLLLSPEALVGGGGSGSGCLPPAHELPPVAFACIDEAHCVSEWSHNFRPCYLRLCKVLRERLGVRCLLGLTATATLSTALDIARHLDISDEDGIAVRSAAVPPNLNLSVSMDREKDQALVSLLKGDRFGCLDSIIVYCTRREETTRVSALLRTCLQGVLVKENPHITNSNPQSNPFGQKKKELAKKKIRKPLKWQAESYHAGLSGSERRRVQNNFMCGELRIVVATVAFGMGLDKSDVRGIIHYNMPKSFESYVQEIGRAGRDAEPAHCHLFLDPDGGDLHELRRHIYADTVDYYTVKRLVQKVFPSCKCKQIHQKQQLLNKDIEDSELLEMMEACEQEKGLIESTQSTNTAEQTPSLSETPPVEAVAPKPEPEPEPRNDDRVQPQTVNILSNSDSDKTTENEESVEFEWPEERVCHSHERAIPVQQTVETLDITEEGVETLLCYLELHPQRFVELLHPTSSQCKVACYNGPRQLQKLTKICPPVAVVLARMRMSGQRVEVMDEVEFDVVEVADTMGWQLPLVKRGLRQLQWSCVGGRSGVMVEFSAPSFYFRSYGDLSDEEMDQVCQFLHHRVQSQEATQLYQLSSCFKAFKSVAYQRVTSCVEDLEATRSLRLKSLLFEYFEKRRDQQHTLDPLEIEELDKYKMADWEGQIRADVRSFLSNRSEEKFSGRAVARIFHGIGSPCFPAIVYGRDRRYWRKYIKFDFNHLIRVATEEIIRFK